MCKNNTNKRDRETTRIYNWVADALRVGINPAYGGYTILKRQFGPVIPFLHDIYRHNIGIPFQKVITGTNTEDTNFDPFRPLTYTEKDFSNRTLNTLDSINISQLDKKVPNWRERTAKGDTVRIPVKGSDYAPNYGGSRNQGELTLKERVFKPIGQIETILGTYNVTATNDNLIVNDIYDFDTNVKAQENGIFSYGYWRNRANLFATPESTPENEKLHFKVTSKRTKP